jgi:hypothetical protein
MDVQTSLYKLVSLLVFLAFTYVSFEEAACLMPIIMAMKMASHGHQVFHFLRVVCLGKGFEDEFSDISDLLFSVRSAF